MTRIPLKGISFIIILIFISIFPIGCKNYEAKKHYKLGKKLIDQGKNEEAIKEFKESIKFNPNNPKAYYRVGQIYLKLDKYDEAIEYFEQSLKIDPLRGDSYKNLVKAYIAKGEKDKALAACERALTKIDDIKVKDELKKLSDQLIENINKEQQDKLKNIEKSE